MMDKYCKDLSAIKNQKLAVPFAYLYSFMQHLEMQIDLTKKQRLEFCSIGTLQKQGGLGDQF